MGDDHKHGNVDGAGNGVSEGDSRNSIHGAGGGMSIGVSNNGDRQNRGGDGVDGSGHVTGSAEGQDSQSQTEGAALSPLGEHMAHMDRVQDLPKDIFGRPDFSAIKTPVGYYSPATGIGYIGSNDKQESGNIFGYKREAAGFTLGLGMGYGAYDLLKTGNYRSALGRSRMALGAGAAISGLLGTPSSAGREIKIVDGQNDIEYESFSPEMRNAIAGAAAAGAAIGGGVLSLNPGVALEAGVWGWGAAQAALQAFPENMLKAIYIKRTDIDRFGRNVDDELQKIEAQKAQFGSMKLHD